MLCPGYELHGKLGFKNGLFAYTQELYILPMKQTMIWKYCGLSLRRSEQPKSSGILGDRPGNEHSSGYGMEPQKTIRTTRLLQANLQHCTQHRWLRRFLRKFTGKNIGFGIQGELIYIRTWENSRTSISNRKGINTIVN